MVTYELREKMNVSSCRFPPEVDEFEMSGLTKAESVLVRPYRVAESPIQLECRHYSTIRLPGNGKVGPTDVIIGKVVGVHVKDEFIMPDGKLDMEKIRPLARMGYSDYTVVDKVFGDEAHSYGQRDGDKGQVHHAPRARGTGGRIQQVRLFGGVSWILISSYTSRR